MNKDFSSDDVIDKTSTFFRRCLDIFGMGTMKEVCRRSQSQVYKYAEDTAHKDSSYQNPADLIFDLFDRLTQARRRDVAVGFVRLAADRIGLDVVEREAARPDKLTIPEEICDTQDVHTVFSREARKTPTVGKIPMIKTLAGCVKSEIDETVALYVEKANDNTVGGDDETG